VGVERDDRGPVAAKSGSLDWAQERDRRQRTLGQQDAADLAALDLDAERLGGLGEGVQGPVGRRLGLVGVQAPVGPAAQPPRRWLLDQGDEPAALVLGERWLAAGTGAVTKPVQPSALNRLMRSRTVWGWQWSSAAIWPVRAPSQLQLIIWARAIQSPGAWRLAASLRTARSSAGSSGGRPRRVGTGSPGRVAGRHQANHPHYLQPN
jgi:hypothetical protein